jgi:Fe-S-cluster containining protein
VSKPSSTRLSFPEAEARQAWLAPLLEAYALIDQGVDAAIRLESDKGRTLACAKGCSSCCRCHLDIPVYPLEVMGIYWFVIEQLSGEPRQRIHDQLADYRPGQPCPFLVDGACGIHALRPLACRQFNVFDTACSEGEDAFHSRRQDVMTPIRRFADEAFFLMLPFYGVEKKGERRKLIQQGGQHRFANVLQQQDWAKLATRMDAHDRQP